MIDLSAIHFLRPWWLLGVVPVILMTLKVLRQSRAAGPWRQVFDPALLEALRISDRRAAITPKLAAVATALVALFALAGPAWQRIPQPLVETREARVIVLDLSRSMQAADVSPSRIESARHAVARFVESLPGGRVGLVVFAGSAFTVMPLTEDRTLALHFLQLLSPDVMPLQGAHISEGLEEAKRLLEGGNALRAEVLLITDSKADEAARTAARSLSLAKHRLWVVGVGTAAGAPVRLASGEFLRDRSGDIVIPGLDEISLETLARAGAGRYHRLTEEDLPIDPRSWTPQRTDPSTALYQTDIWRDEGRWLVLVLAPLAALAFRRGGPAALAGCLLFLAVQPAVAGPTSLEWWLRSPDEAGLVLLESGQHAEAAAAFQDSRWRGVAAYRAQAYGQAAAAFTGESADDHYNRGNSLARAGRYEEAVAAYDAALSLQPDMEDAVFNRALVQKLVPAKSELVMPAGGADVRAADAGGGGKGAKSTGGGGGTKAGGDAHGEGLVDPSRASPNGKQADVEPRTSPQASVGDIDAADHRGPENSRGKPIEVRQGEVPIRTDKASAHGADESGIHARSRRQVESHESNGEAAQWLRHVEEYPGALLKRKLAREQARRPERPDAELQW